MRNVATHYLPKKNDPEVAQLLYRNVEGRWEYHSTCGGGWFNSAYSSQEGEDKLLKIPDGRTD